MKPGCFEYVSTDRNGRASRADYQPGAVHRRGATKRRDLHPPAVRTLFRRKSRSLEASFRAYGAAMGPLRKSALSEGRPLALPRPTSGAEARGREQISEAANRFSSTSGERIYSGIFIFRLSAQPHFSHHHHHTPLKQAGLFTRP